MFDFRHVNLLTGGYALWYQDKGERKRRQSAFPPRQKNGALQMLCSTIYTSARGTWIAALPHAWGFERGKEIR